MLAKSKPCQQINTKCSKDGLRVRLLGGKNAAEDHHYNEDIKQKAEHNIENRKPTRGSAQIQHAMQEGWNCQQQRGNHQAAPEADHVHAKHNRCASQHPEPVVTEHAVLGIGIENERSQKKEEQQKKLSTGQGGRHPARFSQRIAWFMRHVQREPQAILALPALSTQLVHR